MDESNKKKLFCLSEIQMIFQFQFLISIFLNLDSCPVDSYFFLVVKLKKKSCRSKKKIAVIFMCLSSFAGLNIRIVVVSLVGFHQFDGNFHFILSHTHIQTHKAPKQTNKKFFFCRIQKKYYPFLELVVVAVQWVRQLPLQFFFLHSKFCSRNSVAEFICGTEHEKKNENETDLLEAKFRKCA